MGLGQSLTMLYIRSSFVVKNNHRYKQIFWLWCGGTRGGGSCVNMSHPVSDVWLLGLTGTAGDRTIQSGQDWRQSNVGYRLQTYCDVIL